jgi:uncharacterized membrane protein
MVVLSWIVILYGALYLVMRERVFPPDLADSFKARPWGIYPHVIVGMLGLALGPLQFHPRVQQNARVHRRIGTVYFGIAMLVGIVGLYMSLFAFGGLITRIGFGGLALGVLLTTGTAFKLAKSGEFRAHREWMIRSYALMFAAPTLRLWLPLLVTAHQGQFLPAYRLVAWLCWVPNLIFAEWYIARSRKRELRFGGSIMNEDT